MDDFFDDFLEPLDDFDDFLEILDDFDDFLEILDDFDDFLELLDDFFDDLLEPLDNFLDLSFFDCFFAFGVNFSILLFSAIFKNASVLENSIILTAKSAGFKFGCFRFICLNNNVLIFCDADIFLATLLTDLIFLDANLRPFIDSLP